MSEQVLVKVRGVNTILTSQLITFLQEDTLDDDERVHSIIDFFTWISKYQNTYVIVNKDVHYYSADSDSIFLSRLNDKDWLFSEVRRLGDAI